MPRGAHRSARFVTPFSLAGRALLLPPCATAQAKRAESEERKGGRFGDGFWGGGEGMVKAANKVTPANQAGVVDPGRKGLVRAGHVERGVTAPAQQKTVAATSPKV